MDPLIILGVVIIIGAVPATLWWWRIADRWADSEHKRFKPKEEPSDPNPGAAVIRRETIEDGP